MNKQRIKDNFSLKQEDVLLEMADGLKESKTAQEFTDENPILAMGQTGYETDTGKSKIGDGVTAWNGLEYEIGGGVNYSTEEKVVGKFNSITLYQKSFFGSITVAGAIQIVSDINPKYVIGYEGGLNFDGFRDFKDKRIDFGYDGQYEVDVISKDVLTVSVYEAAIIIEKESKRMQLDGTILSNSANEFEEGESYTLTVRYTKEWAFAGNEPIEE